MPFGDKKRKKFIGYLLPDKDASVVLKRFSSDQLEQLDAAFSSKNTNFPRGISRTSYKRKAEFILSDEAKEIKKYLDLLLMLAAVSRSMEEVRQTDEPEEEKDEPPNEPYTVSGMDSAVISPEIQDRQLVEDVQELKADIEESFYQDIPPTFDTDQNVEPEAAPGDYDRRLLEPVADPYLRDRMTNVDVDKSLPIPATAQIRSDASPSLGRPVRQLNTRPIQQILAPNAPRRNIIRKRLITSLRTNPTVRDDFKQAEEKLLDAEQELNISPEESKEAHEALEILADKLIQQNEPSLISNLPWLIIAAGASRASATTAFGKPPPNTNALFEILGLSALLLGKFRQSSFGDDDDDGGEEKKEREEKEGEEKEEVRQADEPAEENIEPIANDRPQARYLGYAALTALGSFPAWLTYLKDRANVPTESASITASELVSRIQNFTGSIGDLEKMVDEYLRGDDTLTEFARKKVMERIQEQIQEQINAAVGTDTETLTKILTDKRNRGSKINITDKEREEMEREAAGTTDIKPIQDVDNERVVGDLRPSFFVVGTNADTETPEQAFKERKDFASFDRVSKGFGNGKKNPLFLQNQQWDRTVRGIASDSLPNIVTPIGKDINYNPYVHNVSDLYHNQRSNQYLSPITNPMIQNQFAIPFYPVIAPTQLMRMPGDTSRSIPLQQTIDVNSGHNTTGIFGPSYNDISGFPVPMEEMLQPTNAKNTLHRIYPVNLNAPTTTQQSLWLYGNSTINPSEGQSYSQDESGQGEYANPNAGFDTGVFTLGTIRSATSLAH